MMRRRVRGDQVLEKCSEQRSERNQIRETIMVRLMGTRNRYISNVIFTNIVLWFDQTKTLYSDLIKLKCSLRDMVSWREHWVQIKRQVWTQPDPRLHMSDTTEIWDWKENGNLINWEDFRRKNDPTCGPFWLCCTGRHLQPLHPQHLHHFWGECQKVPKLQKMYLCPKFHPSSDNN